MCARRAWQLFDWVRGLPEGHVLQGLCDSNTYTTMITLCGPWQQLRRALQLIADMRSRNIECGFLVSSSEFMGADHVVCSDVLPRDVLPLDLRPRTLCCRSPEP